MKFFATLLVAAGVVAAQKTLEDYIPECAIQCLKEGISAATTCDANDLECFCIADNYRATYSAAVGCVLADCGQDVSVGRLRLLLKCRRCLCLPEFADS